MTNRFEEQARERAEHAERMRRENLSSDIPDSVASALYGLAWEAGHANGYSEIEYHYTEMADLVEKVYRAGVENVTR